MGGKDRVGRGREKKIYSRGRMREREMQKKGERDIVHACEWCVLSCQRRWS